MVRDDGIDEDERDRERDREVMLGAVRSRMRERAPAGDAEVPDPGWRTDAGTPIGDFVGERMERFREGMAPLVARDARSALLHTVTDQIAITGAGWFEHLDAPPPRDLLHVYGPDASGTGGESSYRYAWTDVTVGGGSILSTPTQIEQQGWLAGSSYAYSGQAAFAVAGAGMRFIARNGAARVAVRPYLPWQTTASFTGTEATRAAVLCQLGILVESWRPGDTTTVQERDHFITVFAQDTTQYLTGVPAGGTATVSDGLVTDFVAVPGRRYGIYVYAWLETSAAPAGRGELRFCRIDVDARVPFVVAEETLL